jgi:hypothetical protein
MCSFLINWRTSRHLVFLAIADRSGRTTKNVDKFDFSSLFLFYLQILKSGKLDIEIIPVASAGPLIKIGTATNTKPLAFIAAERSYRQSHDHLILNRLGKVDVIAMKENQPHILGRQLRPFIVLFMHLGKTPGVCYGKILLHGQVELFQATAAGISDPGGDPSFNLNHVMKMKGAQTDMYRGGKPAIPDFGHFVKHGKRLRDLFQLEDQPLGLYIVNMNEQPGFPFDPTDRRVV